MDIIVAASKDAIMMVEGELNELPENVVIDALMFAHRRCSPLIELQERLRSAEGRQGEAARVDGRPVVNEDLLARVKEMGVGTRLAAAMSDPRQGQAARREGVSLAAASPPDIRTALTAEGSPWFGQAQGRRRLRSARSRRSTRAGNTLATRRRPDGRAPDEIRQITVRSRACCPAPTARRCSRAARPRCSRRSRSAPGQDEQMRRRPGLEKRKRYIHHYNFPPFTTGEAKRLRGPSRRDIGHGALAERALRAVLPEPGGLPVHDPRRVATSLESNGSSSMARVCGSSLALMDAGVPIKRPVAGIAMGLVTEGDGYRILSDIQGIEDHLGDMDFKVAGTSEGITAPPDGHQDRRASPTRS